MRVRGIVVALAMVLATSAADAKVRLDKAFRFPAGKPARIVVLRPDVQVGSMGVGGVEEPNADWTQSARQSLAGELEREQRATGNQVVFLGDIDGADAQVVADYRALFRAVASAVVEHQMNPLAKLPTKKDRFDWTLGDGAQQLKRIGGGDYALFLYTHDAYGTAGRKAMQFLAAGLFGAVMKAGIHQGYAGLVDLSTGNLVWFNVDPGAGGDPRTGEGAVKRVAQLLRDFPGAAGAMPAPAK